MAVGGAKMFISSTTLANLIGNQKSNGIDSAPIPEHRRDSTGWLLASSGQFGFGEPVWPRGNKSNANRVTRPVSFGAEA